ncbi:pyruvate/2-oxoglutarate dehydrogenase complex dihydrolipoamide dehydrogenase (E3) component [Microbacterium foliorum]|uniref:Pyruvate/2-oxoglutarate dehydrogenase complex dihydrolipoamide dehydrogenase (E3) component n=1 Tax=Microbacterium foliorum TaxID=104336 RepID=A0ABU1HUJ8_9MICO|nr:FAD-dependent oxidoreductase [Microbacterium foliorum]MDR6143725.1 pyruvate/2-oxoglutarate dehydrogenase complex dihydrolipoamide dehydrogenase (E3) component [Microbacterium foliorum]
MSTPSRRPARALTAREAGGRMWDLVVIGAGSAGLVGSRTAAALGARVLLVEAHRFGGECLHTGCVPSKALIASAAAAHAARSSAGLGVTAGEIRVDFPAVMQHVHSAIHDIEPVDSPETLNRDGVHTLVGRARFDGPRSVVVGGERIAFRDALIAAGSTPVRTSVEGEASIDVLTNETFWDLEELPARLLVQGGGAIGCEIAQAMARLGSAVTLVHRGDRLLPKEDAAASAVVLAALRADGVDVRLGTTVRSFDSAGSDDDPSPSGTATLSDGTQVAFDRALAALGRRVEAGDLELSAAGVRLDRRGAVDVDASLRTSNPRIRAAGDVTPLPRFTHTAGMYGSVAATNAVLGLSRKIDADVVPRITFTSPEVAAVGITPDDAPGRGMRVVVHSHAHLDRAIADGHTDGFTSIVVDRRGRVTGAVIVGPRAGESLAEYTVAVKTGMNVRTLATTMHAYPSYSDAGWNAVVKEAQRGLRGGAVAFGIRVLGRIHRRRG